MQPRTIDNDLIIVAEDIPAVRTHCLLSKYKVKNESIINETVDLTQMASPPASEVTLRNPVQYQIRPQYQINPIRFRNELSNQPFLNICSQSNTMQTNNHQRNLITDIHINRNRTGPTYINGNVSNTAIVSNGSNVQPILPSNISINPKPPQPNIELDLTDSNKDLAVTSLPDLLGFIHNRKGCTNATELQNIGSVNMHEFLKSTPAESFSRKGFYSCAGCSSKFTSSDMYNFHLRRQIGDFSYDCVHCSKVIKMTNICQIVIHLLTNHKISTIAMDKLSFKSFLNINDSVEEVNEDFEEMAKSTIKKCIENFLNDWNVDMFNSFQRAPKDQRYYLLPMARKDVVQSHKFYSDHYRAANQKLKEYPVELMHCFMCNFVCESHSDLISHLQGDWPNSVTKCAFCTLSVPLNKEYLCAAKAHVLLHMGIFIMCPRCGFVPPPDLNPEEFEITLRLHLRYVCFHFNLIQIYICPHCGDSNSKAFNTSNQVTMHIFDEHLTEFRSCSICSTNNNIPSEGPFRHFEMTQHLVSAHNRADIAIVWNDCPIAGKKCNECSEIIAQRDSYFSHMTNNHKTLIVKGKSAFRCFGTCKRIHQSIDEFQSHRSECSECINVKNKLYQPHLPNASPELTSLCFCLYCGVGVRRKRLENGEIETQSEPQMFANLSLTHEHEQDHILCETNITACPWCPNRMSAKINEMTQHMETHLPENWFLSWYTKRAQKYNYNRNDIVNCYCFAAIDNPLSLHCHAIPQMLGTASSNGSSSKHLALTDSIHREFLTAPRHRVPGTCPMCTESDIITNSIDMSWHIFFKHRNILCYVCKNFRLLNADNSPKCRITMWNHVYSCLRRHTPRFNLKSGLTLLQSIANCETVMSDCTVFDLKKSGEIHVGLFADPGDPDDQALSSGNTELAKSAFSDTKFECGFCRETAIQSNFFSSRTLLNEHLKACHGITADQQSADDFLCYICGLKFDSRDKWEDHTLAEHSKGFRKLGLSLINPTSVVLDTTCISYRCYLCNHRFDKKISCANHMKDNHSIDDSELNWGMLTDSSVVSDTNKRAKQTINSSKMCLSTYPSKRLKVEDSLNTEESVYVCGICPFQCNARKEMIDHAISFHVKSSEKSLNSTNCFVCPDCALSFISNRSRAIHLKLVHRISNPTLFMEQFSDS